MPDRRSPSAQCEWQRDSGELFGFGPCARSQDVAGIDEAESAFLQAEGNGWHIRQLRKKLTLVLNISANHRHRFQCDRPTAEGMYLHQRVTPARLSVRLPVLTFNRGRFVVRPGIGLFNEIKLAGGKIQGKFQRRPRECADEEHVNPLARNHAGAVLRGQQQVALGEQLRRRQQTERFADAFLIGLIKFR